MMWTSLLHNTSPSCYAHWLSLFTVRSDEDEVSPGPMSFNDACATFWWISITRVGYSQQHGVRNPLCNTQTKNHIPWFCHSLSGTLPIQAFGDGLCHTGLGPWWQGTKMQISGAFCSHWEATWADIIYRLFWEHPSTWLVSESMKRNIHYSLWAGGGPVSNPAPSC